ncbi:MAG: exo-alpha-sialidase, partial [Solirubrobacterales bacterium]|nr:exo-alpha-sialidase [Solirubrobacterales bacterium]
RHGDAAGVCAAVSPTSRRRQAEFGADRLRLKPASCEATIGRLLDSPGGPRLRSLGSARIVSVERHGDRADVRIVGFDRPTEVVKQGKTWLIDASPAAEKD